MGLGPIGLVPSQVRILLPALNLFLGRKASTKGIVTFSFGAGRKKSILLNLVWPTSLDMTKDVVDINLGSIKLVFRVISGIFGCVFSVFLIIMSTLVFSGPSTSMVIIPFLFLLFGGLLGVFLSLHFMIPNQG